MARSRQESTHAQLNRLRQQTATERMTERELAVRLGAAKAAVDDAGAAVTEAYAADDAKLATRRRQELGLEGIGLGLGPLGPQPGSVEAVLKIANPASYLTSANPRPARWLRG
jgi:hypothetical protein